ncbi:MAG TPA: saccharopine dehydrogenase NADP-binding domain-containing protein [Thermoanaerobaculia bacterium]|jgi:short subunit dehydrogenase-like uncharacterized protein|nr:saccharopine dehydrogenase NADP-binding domain-containing protein [Thermoanaerobaculia bacterium]
MMRRWTIYGATGFTGRLLAREAVRQGFEPVLAGRDGARLREVAVPLGLEPRAVGLDDPCRLARALEDGELVLNAAGPFTATAGPLARACLDAGVHYLDLTGEIEVFEALHRLDGEARSRGVLLLPGAGFLIVPSDCLAAHLARRLPSARWLRLAVSGLPLPSRGSLLTMIGMISPGAYVRHRGELTLLPGCRLEHQVDFGGGPRTCLVVSWADAYTAYITTGIPSIEVCLEVDPWQKLFFLNSRSFAWLLQRPAWQEVLKAQAALLPEGPSEAERSRLRRVIMGVAGDDQGCRVAARLRTPESHTLTVLAALGCVSKVLAGELRSGFQTPAGLYGADFVLGLPGVEREDLEV